MIQLNINVLAPAGELHTFYELIKTALEARVYSAVPATQATQLAQQLSYYKGGGQGAQGSIKPDVNVYLIDAYKGNANGVIVPASWTLPGDVTNQPGGGVLYEGGIERLLPMYIDLSGRGIYAAAQAHIDLDITLM